MKLFKNRNFTHFERHTVLWDEFLTENPFTRRSESQIREQHNEIEFFRMTFWLYEDFAK